MIEKLEAQFTKYEVARILGARALQLAMDAPFLIKIDDKKLDDINFDVLKIAELELESGILPITVKRPFPKRKDEKIKKISKEEAKLIEEELKKKEERKEKILDKKVGEKEELEEKDIKEEGEIMELAQPEDEVEIEEKPEVQEI